MEHFDELDPMDIFHESLNSVEFHESLKSKNLEVSDFIIKNYEDQIQIYIAKIEKEHCLWAVHDLEEDYDFRPFTLGDFVFPHHENFDDGELHLFHENRFLGALKLLEHIFGSIFTGAIKSSSFYTFTGPNQRIYDFQVEIFKFPLVAHCEKLMLWERDCSSKTMMDQILELAVAVKKLDLRCELPPDWRNQKILKIPTLLAWPALWFTTTDLLINLDCEVANINETNLKWQAFKAFMLKWQMVEDPGKLKMLEISFDGDYDGWQLDGLNLKETEEIERDTHFPDLLKGLDAPWQSMQYATDIQRADGLLASFWRRERSFHFVVWHDPHPIATWQPDQELLVVLDDGDCVDEEEEDE